MELAIDLGNSRTTFAIFEQDEIVKHWAVDTSKESAPSYYEGKIRDTLLESDLTPTHIDCVTLCSVVPDLTSSFTKVLQLIFDCQPYVVRYGEIHGVRSLTDNPHELGADLYCNAIAAHHLIQRPSVVVDLGTALTFLVLRDAEILGVAIAPGIATALHALYQKTAQLPHVSLKKPASSIGKNTTDAILAGVIGGYEGLIRSKLDAIKSEFGTDLHVIGTGGFSHELENTTVEFDHVDPLLTLKGIHIYGQQLQREILQPDS